MPPRTFEGEGSVDIRPICLIGFGLDVARTGRE